MPSFKTRVKHAVKMFYVRHVLTWLSPEKQLTLGARLRPVHPPEHVFLEPTTQCNLKCLHCGRTYWKDRDQHRDLDLETFKKVVAELVGMGLRVITIQGVGEPLLHPDIFEMITFAQAQGLRTRFNTNFTVLDEASAERLVRVGHSEVMVSIESIDPEMYADIRRGGTIDTVLSNIALLAATKRRLGSNTPEINVSAVLLRSTLDQVEHLVSEMKRLGVTKLNFQGLQTEGIPERSRLRNGTRLRDNALSTLSAAEIDAITQRIRALDSPELPVTTHWDLGGRGSENIPQGGIRTCRDLWEAPYIDSGGRVTPCCLLPDASLMNMGDLHDKTFTEIWNGPEYQTLRAQHLNNQPPKVCQGCQSMNWIFDPKTGDFVMHGSDERFDKYFVRPPA